MCHNEFALISTRDVSLGLHLSAYALSKLAIATVPWKQGAKAACDSNSGVPRPLVLDLESVRFG